MTETVPEPAAGLPPHGLRWGIKTSFIDYVRRMPGGRGTVGEGATPVGSHEMLFALDAAPPPAEATAGAVRAWAFRGDVRFTGHGGMLFVRVANPWVVLGADEAVLSIEDPYQTPDAPRLPLVTMRLRSDPAAEADGLEAWFSTEVRLTPEGVELFNDVYQVGEAFEPVAIIAPLPTT
ncbi:HtaA domain-containing protein [Nocardioides alkalitolerans]|uniref:HtaA domain-containing protein n=1 Tax=Nocardioides alkalitolerans TaxID=281714 RepID=UPI0004137C2A|nr:HtaA domain-containing protein [Nocardioides alkalitolerans]